MKKNLILFVTVFALAVFLVIAFASSDFAVPDGYDPVEERVKHGLTYDYKELGLTYDCRAIEEDTEGPWDFPPDDSFDEETGSREYRLADKQTAELLRRVCEEREGAARAQHYYDITVSFEKADRIEAMYKMLEVYDAASVEEKRCFDWYMSSYAPFAGDDVLLEKVNKISWDNRDVSRTYNRSYGYNRGAAARWAYDHYDSYSPDFPNLSYLGGDCANFVSHTKIL